LVKILSDWIVGVRLILSKKRLMKCLCIDPSGTGATGVFFFQTDGKSKPIFSEYKS